MGTAPLCGEQYPRTFSTTRIPCLVQGKLLVLVCLGSGTGTGQKLEWTLNHQGCKLENLAMYCASYMVRAIVWVRYRVHFSSDFHLELVI